MKDQQKTVTQDEILEIINELSKLTVRLSQLERGQSLGYRGVMAAIGAAIVDIKKSMLMLIEAIDFFPEKRR